MGADRVVAAALAAEGAGPKPVDDRLCLQGILYVLYNDDSWQLLPLKLGFGSGQTCWRRLGRWHEAGAFDKLHRLLLAELHAADALDWTRACLYALSPTWWASPIESVAGPSGRTPPSLSWAWVLPCLSSGSRPYQTPDSRILWHLRGVEPTRAALAPFRARR
ncbi:transposase [Streptomyces sp. 8N616]|uniref:transposase n=1 Tax=Streptomyces sp. 8N616 TaxID=3457414 RepID=UPI003FD16694